MYFLVVLIIDDVNKSPQIIEAWAEAGVSGITIIESTGLGRPRDNVSLLDTNIMTSIRTLLQHREDPNRTMFSIVEGEAMVDKLIAVTEKTVGKLSDPHRGLLFALPLARVVGLATDQRGAYRPMDAENL